MSEDTTNEALSSTKEEEITNLPPVNKGPKPAPIENPKGLGWFDGTSWGNRR